MSLTGRDVAEIMRALEQSGFDSLDLEINGVQLHLRRGGASSVEPLPAGASVPAGRTSAAPAASPSLQAAASDSLQAAGTGGDRPSKPRADATPVPAPLLGIFHRAPKPGEAPFVQVGERVQADSVIGIIEVMKLMNSVRAGIAGEVIEFSAGNGELVEYGQALLWIRRD